MIVDALVRTLELTAAVGLLAIVVDIAGLVVEAGRRAMGGR